MLKVEGWILRETLFVSRQLGLARSFTKELKTWQLGYRFSAFCRGLKWVSKNKVIAVGETSLFNFDDLFSHLVLVATLERVAILNTDPLHAFQVWCGRWQQSLWCFFWTCVGNSVKEVWQVSLGVCSGRVQFVLWTRGLECEILFGKHHFGLYFKVLCSKQLVKAASL